MDFIKTLFLCLVITSCTVPEPQDKVGISLPASMAHEPETGSWSNPNIINGSSFGNVINTAYRIENFDLLYALTDSTTRRKYSKQEITDLCSTLGLGFEMRLLNTKKDSGIYSMSYEVMVDATRQIIRLPVVVENDTCRLLLMEFGSCMGMIKR